ncbi:MAG: type II toxin-antitoxin system HicA family toxin [Bryobacterales bacterium]|nr:type II toxin-antitoxin system HicA family toxin [Bryobacterales bacterium]
MARLRILSGAEVLAILRGFGFAEFSQRGSHIKVRRLSGKQVQTLTVPNHREIDRGTLQAILRQASRFIPESELRSRFYAD